ncbi:MAG: hypothetical protein WCW13_05685 [archaeon]|jgi:hypothetical protein
MPLPTKGTFARKALALNIKYQRKYPEIIQGQLIKGRFSLDKRSDFYRSLVNLSVEDKKLVAILTEPAPKDLGKKIAEHAMNKCGSKPSAIEYLSGLKKRIEELSKENGLVDAKLLKLLKITPEEQNKFLKHHNHMINSASGIICARLTLGLRELKH